MYIDFEFAKHKNKSWVSDLTYLEIDFEFKSQIL